MRGPPPGLAALVSAQAAVAAWAAPAPVGHARPPTHPPTCPHPQECESAEDEFALLQTAARLSGIARPTPPAAAARAHDPLEVPSPIWWFHVPKCGSSFLNTLIHVPGTCPGVPASLVVSEDTFGYRMLKDFRYTFGTHQNCPGLEVDHLYHYGIGSAYDGAKGRLMTFLRQPEQRLISYYHYAFENRTESTTLEEFAAKNSTPGCAVKMLTRDGDHLCHAQPPVKASEVALARRRLREGFAFVGITDEWDLSICLFNRMFNNACSRSQFQDTRPGAAHRDHLYDTAPLGGFRDSYDGVIFEEAQAIFRENLALFDVSLESCEPCFREAGLL